MYEQLQEFLNECIRLGYDYMGMDMRRDDRDRALKFNVRYDGLFLINNEDGIIREMSYHELFSVDSGIMERVEWKRGVEENQLDDMLRFAEEKGWDYDNKIDLVSWKYMIMGPMTAEEKIKYFLVQAKLPQQSE